MTQPNVDRRRILRWVVAGTTVLAGCGRTDRSTPEPAPPPNATGSPPTDVLGPGPEDQETPIHNETAPPPTGTPRPDDVVFSKPGGEVTATLYGGGDCAVVLVPQVDMDRQSWYQFAQRLAGRGYRAMAIDEGETRKAAGVEAAISYLRDSVGVEMVVVVGASTGGEAAVRAAAAAKSDTVDGVVTLSAAGGADVANQLAMPALFVVSEGDAQRFVTTAEQLAEGAPGEDQLVTYDGDAHGQGLLQSPHAEALRRRIGSFLSQVCQSRTGTPTVILTTTP